MDKEDRVEHYSVKKENRKCGDVLNDLFVSVFTKATGGDWMPTIRNAEENGGRSEVKIGKK